MALQNADLLFTNGAAERFLNGWCRRAQASGIRVLQTMSKTLLTHRTGLLNWYINAISTGPVEGSNNAIAAGLSSFQGTTHHQKLDVERHPEKAKPTGERLRAKDRPLINDFVTDQQFDVLLDAWFGNAARVLMPGRGFYIWGGYANYPPFLKKHALYFSQAIIWDKQHSVLTRKDFIGGTRMVFLLLEGRSRPPVPRPQQCH